MIDDFRRPAEPVVPKPDNLNQDFPGVKPDEANLTTAAPVPEPKKISAFQPKVTKAWYKLRWPPSKKDWLISALLLLVGAAGIIYYLPSHLKTPEVKITIKSPYHKPVSTLVPSTLTGLPVQPSVNQRPVTAVMIENSTDARPQSGLDQAGVVFEALAEGGITRFMALYQDTQPSYLGPIRSARPYYISWALGFDAAYAHVGGSPDALSDITSWGVKDLNQFYNGSYYTRITSRAAPHNVYTSISELNNLEIAKGYTSSKYSGFVRNLANGVASKTPTATNINLTFSGPDYNVSYVYNAQANDYERYEGGAPHTEIDASGNQTTITPKVIVAMVVPESQGALDASGAYYSDYNTIGNGPVDIFQDGTVESGTWQKTSNNSQITFTGQDGKVLKLDPGQTWVEAIKSSSDISYST